MSDSMGFGRYRLWAVAVVVAGMLPSLTGHGALTSQAAADPPLVVASESETLASEETDPDKEFAAEANVEETETEDAEATESKETESGEQEIAEESDREREFDPEEEESETPSAEQDDDDSKQSEKKKRIIGATARLLEKQSGLLFRARVDTGAKSCSLHVEDMVIEKEEDKWVDNIGKVIRFKVKNHSEETHWISGRIDGYVIIKTSDARERRYKVPLILRWKGLEKKVLVTLNNRNGMEYPLLLGRNFLRGDFLVDVDIDNDD